MTVHLGVLMDPLASINPRKDSTLAMMRAAQARGWSVSCFTQADLFIENGEVSIDRTEIILNDDLENWFEIKSQEVVAADQFDAVLMRKDPPFDMEYIYATYLLEFIEKAGTPVLNRPGSIRDCNEKLFALQFQDCCPPHLVSRNQKNLRRFHGEHEDVIFKPLDGMDGESIFRAKSGEHNL